MTHFPQVVLFSVRMFNSTYHSASREQNDTVRTAATTTAKCCLLGQLLQVLRTLRFHCIAMPHYLERAHGIKTRYFQSLSVQCPFKMMAGGTWPCPNTPAELGVDNRIRTSTCKTIERGWAAALDRRNELVNIEWRFSPTGESKGLK